ncbi:hypothetical protein A2348_00950 [Candidatus Uhrbacteria bacterium RIFOXYB12_FULL_58_10]|nr:MAG: hypothetical protein A2348_00950 [Candidatus Uhrbacteria bacterium RIFOXYB12_FULL_58_10]
MSLVSPDVLLPSVRFLFRFHEFARLDEILALFLHLKASQGADLFRTAVRFFFMEPKFACFQNIPALLDTTGKPAQESFEAFAFAAFNVYHRDFTFLSNNKMTGAYQKRVGTSSVIAPRPGSAG